MKKIILTAVILLSQALIAQVGVNVTTPQGAFDVVSNTSGIIIPRIALTATNVAAPVVNPQGGALATSTLIYNTATAGVSPNNVVPGFYFWDNTATKWIPIISGNLGGTLDQAYDFGGAGAGKTITADAGAVTITGTDGFVSTGTTGSGVTAPAGSGTRMVWNPRKAALRAGTVSSTRWDDANLGQNSIGLGESTLASGNAAVALGRFAAASGDDAVAFGFSSDAAGFRSTAFGDNTTASGDQSTAFGDGSAATAFRSTAFGYITTASGDKSTAFGGATLASGETATAFGGDTTAEARLSTVFGKGHVAASYGETVIGLGATNYAITTNGRTQFGPANATDRLFVIGNAIDANGNDVVDSAERSDAMVVLKNGRIGLGSSNPAEKLVVVGNIRNNVLAGVGNRLVASNGTGNLISMASGTNGQVMTQTAAGPVFQTLPSLGCTLDQAYDFGGAGLGRTITADTGAVTIDGTDGLVATGTIGTGAIVPSGAGTRMVWNPRKAAFRAGIVSGTLWDDANLGTYSAAFGLSTESSGVASFSAGRDNRAAGSYTIAFGKDSEALGRFSSAFGIGNTAPSYGETVLGIGATTYTPGTNATTTFNPTDRLLSVGNGNDLNSDDIIVAGERSDALVILKNGNTGIGSSTPQDKLHVVGNIRMVDGNQAAGKVLTSNANGTASWQNVSANAWGLLGNSGTNPATQFIGTIDAQPLQFRVANSFAGQIGNNTTALVSFGRGAGALVTAVSSKVTAIGAGAGAANTDGDSNTYVGANAGAAMTTSFFSTYVGAEAGRFATASNNAFFGYEAGGQAALTGGLNTFVGSQAGLLNTSGNGNTFLGFAAGHATTTGSQNVYIGRDAGNAAQTASANVFVGSFSGTDTTTAGHTIVGGNAGRFNTTGANNTFLGFNTAASNLTGSNNVLLGNDADVVSDGFNNATAIGYRAAVGASNSLVLGSINGVNGATSSVNVGIGTTNPNAALEIVDTNVVTSGTVEGNLNIATNNPQNTDIGASITLSGYGSSTTATSVFASVEGRKSNNGAASDSGYLSFKTNNVGTLAERMRITNVGDVGIGLPNPGGQFQLSLDEGRKPGTNTWTIASDERLKTIQGDYAKGLNDIVKLRPITYHYKNTGTRTFEPDVLQTEYSGFSAQQVQQVFPEAVGADEDGYLNFNLHPILVAQVNAIRELDEKNKQLQTQNEDLKKELEAIKQQVAAILEQVTQR